MERGKDRDGMASMSWLRRLRDGMNRIKSWQEEQRREGLKKDGVVDQLGKRLEEARGEVRRMENVSGQHGCSSYKSAHVRLYDRRTKRFS